MKIKLKDNGHKFQAELLSRNIEERIPVQHGADGLVINIDINQTLGRSESYQIFKQNEVWNIIGSDELGLNYGIGKFLHTAT